MPVFTPVMTPESFRSGSAAPISIAEEHGHRRDAQRLVAHSNAEDVRLLIDHQVALRRRRPVHNMPMPSSSVTGLDSEL